MSTRCSIDLERYLAYRDSVCVAGVARAIIMQTTYRKHAEGQRIADLMAIV